MPQKTTTAQATSNQSTASPWSPQIPYLEDAFNKAQSTYNQGAGSVYNGQQVAGFTPDQLATFRQMVGYGQDPSIASTTAGVGSGLATAGQSGLTNAMDLLRGFHPQDNTQSNISNAGLYANNPNISDQVTAAMRDATRNVSENVLPQIARTAATGGDINSNRTAIQQGIVGRGLADATADTSAQLRGNAYNTGLGLSEQGNEFNTNAMLDAMKASGQLGATAAGTGVDALSSAVGQQQSLYNMAGVGGQGEQDAQQAGINNAQAMANAPTDRLNQLLAQYFGIVGGTGYGGTSTSNGSSTGSTSTQASPFSIAGGLMGAAGSMFMPGAFTGVSAARNIGRLFGGGSIS